MSPNFPPIPKDAAKDFQGMVIIIGAGASGLMAANALKFMGVENYLVLEASDRIGGRLKKTDMLHEEVPLDVGAEWIHEPDGQLLKDMLVYNEDSILEGQDDVGLGLEPSEFIKYSPEFFFRQKKNTFLSWVYGESDEKWKRSTWWDWLDKYVYRHVQEKVKFNSPVKKVEYGSDDDKLKIYSATGERYTCDKIICTVPLAVLKQGSVHFDPPLPEKKLKAIKKIDMPPGLRVYFEMKENFYPDITIDNTLIGQAFDGDRYTGCAVYDALFGKELSNGQNILGFVAIGEKFAGELSTLSDEELVKATLAKIDILFDGKGSKNYMKHVVQNWTKEPYVLGSYSFPGPAKYKSELGKTVGENLLFAGEHTSVKHHGFVQGAVMEGRRAAVEAVLGYRI